MNYAKIKEYDIANGPGVRISLFVSGCFNQETWDFKYDEKFTKYTLNHLFELIDQPERSK